MFSNLKASLLQVNSRTIYLYSLISGLLTGFVAVLFHQGLLALHHIFYETLVKISIFSSHSGLNEFDWDFTPRHLLILFLPALGGLISGILCYYFAPEAAGSGIDEFLDSFHNRSGSLRKRTSIIKFFASMFTLASGGSAGREGPMALIGASIGSLFGKFVKMGARAKRTLLLAGAAGGLGAIFRAPLGGAIVAVEVLYQEDFESDSLIPCILSSVTAYTVFSSMVGFGHYFHFYTAGFHNPVTLIFYVVLGLICTVFSYFFTRLFQFFRDKVFSRLPVPQIFMPAVGGLCVGALGVFFPEILGEGLSVLQKTLDGEYSRFWASSALLFFLFALLKMFATNFTVQSGGSGGTLMPSMFIGGMVGASFGTILQHFFPTLVPEIGPYIVVGMASFFSAMTSASLGALVMVSEITGGYDLLPALMVVAVISLIFSHKWSIYKHQVKNKFYSKAHLWDMNPMKLKQTLVSTLLAPEMHHKAIVSHKVSLAELKEIAQVTHETDFILINDDNEFVGVLSLKDILNKEEQLKEAQNVVLAEDLMSRRQFYVTERDNLYKAMQYLLESDFDKVPVVEELDHKKILKGCLQYKDLLRHYHLLEKEEGV